MEDACELGRRAIYHATFRDAVSGGTVYVPAGLSGPSRADFIAIPATSMTCDMTQAYDFLFVSTD